MARPRLPFVCCLCMVHYCIASLSKNKNAVVVVIAAVVIAVVVVVVLFVCFQFVLSELVRISSYWKLCRQ